MAIFGGTFNPIHWGHLLMAETALTQFSLDTIVWVPAWRPPHKSQPLLEFEHRLEMVQRAIADHSAFLASNIETQQPEISYAIATLQALKASHPEASWSWIVGIDAFQTLPKWRAAEQIAAQCVWLVAPRAHRREFSIVENQELGTRLANSSWPATSASVMREAFVSAARSDGLVEEESMLICQQVSRQLAARSVQLRWHLIEMPRVEISSSLIRQYCREQRSIRYLVPETVRDYILTKKLYQMS